MNWVKVDAYCIRSDCRKYTITRCAVNGGEKFEVWRGRMHVTTHDDAAAARTSALQHSERFDAGVMA